MIIRKLSDVARLHRNAWMREYTKKPDVKAKRNAMARIYRKKPEVKAWYKEYRNRPDVRDKRRVRHDARRQIVKVRRREQRRIEKQECSRVNKIMSDIIDKQELIMQAERKTRLDILMKDCEGAFITI